MATPSSGPISFTQVASTELGLTTPYRMSDMYAVAVAGGQAGLMYHNINMAIGNLTTAKTAIYGPYAAGSNRLLTNWYNYAQDTGMVMTYLITNNSNYDLYISVVIWDSSNTTQGTIYNSSVNGMQDTGTQTVDTGLLSQSASMASGYQIAVDGVSFINPPNPGQIFTVNLTVDSASDSDGVGYGKSRKAYGLGGYTEEGQGNPGYPSPPWTPTLAVDGNGSTISTNKRTTFSITIS